MNISIKKITVWCIIILIIAFSVCRIIYIQKPHFSRYKSYTVVTDNGEIPLTDEQFQQIVQIYKNDEELHHEPFADSYIVGYKLHLYYSDDMSGKYVGMCPGRIGDRSEMYLHLDGKDYSYNKSDTVRQVNAIISEAISQYETEQEV